MTPMVVMVTVAVVMMSVMAVMAVAVMPMSVPASDQNNVATTGVVFDGFRNICQSTSSRNCRRGCSIGGPERTH